ncbi:MAG: carbamoyltransferase HypF [Methanobrevibacter sp.]|jgi:hydrogenase maturation protein HypF|nr:carbamoyltransferase HypF [Candidatus Methanovirga meridionalis]
METVKIWIQGIVQGVGFRPNTYRIAKNLNINGYVRNLGNLVEIIAQGENIKEFIESLSNEKPPVCKINSIEYKNIDSAKRFFDFKILESSLNSSGTSVIPPDLGLCENCLTELRDKNNRRYRFPFIACTDCGPRFSVIKSIPYDRNRTTMDDFPLCGECLIEYENPLDRRYHAEASCCDKCGPSLSLYDGEHDEIFDTNPIKKTVELLDDGNIIAMKGIGGTHLVCKVTDEDIILNLRKRLNRPNQPFAIMSSDIETIKTFAEINELEEKSLKSIESPIVVVKKNKNYSFPDSLAPILHNIGVILPYSPIHHLLFDYTNEPAYVMTSANIPGEPMLINNKDILNELKGIADYFLLHNRKIANRCDDSVIRYIDGKLSFIRRSRGYTPSPYNLKKYSNDLNVLALGSELDLTFTILKNGLGFVSQHIGNTNKFKTYQFLQDGIKHLSAITSTNNFDVITVDMHPQFFTSSLGVELSEKYGAELQRIQHHHAHGAVLAFDNNVDELVFIGADGVGYGDDKTAWGGEVLYSDIGSYKRLASLSPQKIPGGDISTKYPARFLLSILYDAYDKDELRSLFLNNYADFFKYGEREINMVIKQLEKDFNVPITTSAGRVLDSISVALGICGKRTYEGEASMKLESIAYKSNNNLKIDLEFKKEGNRSVLDTTAILKQVIEMKNNGLNIKDIAKAAQDAIAIGLGKMAVDGANLKNIDVIGATGGVMYNEAISNSIKEYVEKQGFKFIRNNNSCAGDGSVSLGQAIISAYRND